ncbi:MAG TPA: TonB-dependent receptor [Bacteroidales bacterium]|nr:TonB-dependent receptor [Bacteroidales bacterium]
MYTLNSTRTIQNQQAHAASYPASFANSHILRTSVIALLFSLLFLFSANAQKSGKVSGKLLAVNTNEPIEFATVAIYNLPDSTLVKGVITDNTGAFRIDGLSNGKYYLKASYLGYKPIVRNNISLSDTQTEFVAGNINLEEDVKSIKEVTVEGERLKGTAEVDKLVYAVTPKAAAVAHSGLELLRQVPAVQVDFQNNLTLEGSSNVMILVDGIQRDKEYLAQLDPSSIDKVEVMTNPSSKYDASIDGVINILLKKTARLGYSGRIEAEIPLGNRFSNSSANFEAGVGPIRLFGSASLHAEKFDLNSTLSRKSVAGNSTSMYAQNGNGTGEWTYVGINYGFDYFIDKNNTLSFYANMRPETGGRMRTYSANDLTQNGSFVSYDSTDLLDKDLNKSQYYSVFYKKNFSKPSQELTIDVNYSTYTGTSYSAYNSQYFLSDRATHLGNSIFRSEKSIADKDAWGIKVDYTQPVGDKLKLYAGYNGYIQALNNSFLKGSDAGSEKFKFDETRSAFYLSASGAVKSVNWQAGLRYEMSFIEMNKSTKTDYDCLLPNISLQQKLSKTNTLKISYRKSIQRPGANDLNPFVNYIDSVTIFRGNPNLGPSYTHKIEMNMSMQLGKSFITPGIYYSRFSDNVQQIKFINQDGITENFNENIGNGNEYGLNFSGSVKITNKIQLNPYFAVFSKTLNSVDLYNIREASKVSWRSNLTLITNITDKLLFFSYFQYNSPYISAQRVIKRDAIYVFGLERNIFKNNNGKISITTINPFTKKFSIENSVTEAANLRQEQDITVDVQPLVTVKFSYSFNKGKEIKKMDRKREIESDSKESMF